MARSFSGVKLSEVTKNDLELLLSWRSNPLIYKYFRKQRQPLEWPGHLKFWQELNPKKSIHFVILLEEDNLWRKVGSVGFSELDLSMPEFAVYIGETTLQKQGVATKAIKLGIEWLKKKNYHQALATINKKNLPSLRLFLKAGFVKKNTKENSDWQEYILSF